ncbi:hypothetical protein RJT34_16065 [Clitoria ternatea]|uniref:Uncharacterized protein n=1 Tax=Clitoria ternatea TaxID=43366 RepID=A0AAN9J6I6_CLITE
MVKGLGLKTCPALRQRFSNELRNLAKLRYRNLVQLGRNITSSTMTLEPDMNPRLGSFALAEFLARNEHGHHVIIDRNKFVRGIFGYLSPECMEFGEPTVAADVIVLVWWFLKL